MERTNDVSWRQLTLGHLSRNKFWGEDPDTQYHPVVASSVLVQDGGTPILVDPTLPVEEMERRLQRCCGLDRTGIDIVFATHFHTDHRVDAEKYPNARLYMSPESVREAADLRSQGGPLAQAFLNGAVFDFQAAPRRLSPNVAVQPLPGHTLGLAGLVFTSGGKRVLLSGDTIMNREYYRAREGYFIDASQQKTAASMEWAAANTDVIVPGHGDWFFADETAAAGAPLDWRKLNLCAAGEEAAVLVRAGTETLLINLVLPGHLLRDALFDAAGLEPSAVTRVLCLKNDPQHTRDLPVMKNARFYLPERLAVAPGSAPAPGRPAFEAWRPTPSLPVAVADAGGTAVCLFGCGGRRIAVAAGPCGRQFLLDRGVDVALAGGPEQFLS